MKAYHLVMIMTETKTYKKSNTKTKTFFRGECRSFAQITWSILHPDPAGKLVSCGSHQAQNCAACPQVIDNFPIFLYHPKSFCALDLYFTSI